MLSAVGEDGPLSRRLAKDASTALDIILAKIYYGVLMKGAYEPGNSGLGRSGGEALK